MSKRLLDRIPRPMYQVGLVESGRIEWGYICENRKKLKESLEMESESGEYSATYRVVWMSPAKLASIPEFMGW